MDLPYTIAAGYKTKEPCRGSEYSAGLDIYIPELSYQFMSDYWEKNSVAFTSEEARKEYYNKVANGDYPFNIIIREHERAVIPTGLRFNIPSGTYLEVANRSSIAAKSGLIYGAHIIDEDYRGIVFINLINTSSNQVVLVCGQKFAQLIHKKYIRSDPIQIPEEEIQVTARGAGALGSTGA